MIRKSLFCLMVLFLAGILASPGSAQDNKTIEGNWYGTLNAGGKKLPIVFHISRDKSGKLVASMDSPDQGAYGIPMTRVDYSAPNLILEIKSANGKYTGQLTGGELQGTWQQGFFKAALNLTPKAPPAPARPQHPKKPYPYKEEEVVFENVKEGHTLAGTLTIPQGKGPFAAAILISGSGSQDRDESLMGHKPFLVLADHLTRAGIAVLRYDDRGTAKSKGNIVGATSLDLSYDAEGAFHYLETRKEIDHNKIGFVGHSEGGMIAPMIAARNNKVAFIVLLAGPGIKLSEAMVLQNAAASKAAGAFPKIIELNRKVNAAVYEEIIAQADDAKATRNIKKRIAEIMAKEAEYFQKQYAQAFSDSRIKQILSPWFRYFIAYHPEPVLKQVKCPVLALNGEKDIQVTAKENLAGIEKALKAGGNKDFTVKEFKGLNHLFQHCKTGSVTEYGKIEETFSPEALEIISTWIKKRF